MSYSLRLCSFCQLQSSYTQSRGLPVHISDGSATVCPRCGLTDEGPLIDWSPAHRVYSDDSESERLSKIQHVTINPRLYLVPKTGMHQLDVDEKFLHRGYKTLRRWVAALFPDITPAVVLLDASVFFQQAVSRQMIQKQRTKTLTLETDPLIKQQQPIGSPAKRQRATKTQGPTQLMKRRRAFQARPEEEVPDADQRSFAQSSTETQEHSLPLLQLRHSVAGRMPSGERPEEERDEAKVWQSDEAKEDEAKEWQSDEAKEWQSDEAKEWGPDEAKDEAKDVDLTEIELTSREKLSRFNTFVVASLLASLRQNDIFSITLETLNGFVIGKKVTLRMLNNCFFEWKQLGILENLVSTPP